MDETRGEDKAAKDAATNAAKIIQGECNEEMEAENEQDRQGCQLFQNRWTIGHWRQVQGSYLIMIAAGAENIALLLPAVCGRTIKWK